MIVKKTDSHMHYSLIDATQDVMCPTSTKPRMNGKGGNNQLQIILES